MFCFSEAYCMYIGHDDSTIHIVVVVVVIIIIIIIRTASALVSGIFWSKRSVTD